MPIFCIDKHKIYICIRKTLQQALPVRPKAKKTLLHLAPKMFWTVLTYVLIGLLSLFGLFYLWLEVRFYRALGTVREGRSTVNPPPRVSVLIAARNESAGIRATLDSAKRELDPLCGRDKKGKGHRYTSQGNGRIKRC